MSNKDKSVWDAYTRGVKPVGARAKKQSPDPKPVRAVLRDKDASRVRFAEPLPALSGEGAELKLVSRLERNREKRLREGAFEIEAKLDLHGLTQPEAFDALASFLRKKNRAGKRHLLIVTGKGASGEGVLRRNLKQWLSQLPEASSILAIREASPLHGGEGAFYVLLRRKRAPSKSVS